MDVLVDMYVDLLKDEHCDVRKRAAICLQEMGANAAPAVLPLVEAANDSHQWVRRAALRALAAIDSDQAHETLVKLLTDDDPRKRNTAAGVLSQIHPSGKAIISALHRALDDSNPGVRANAAHALGNYGSDGKCAAKDLVNRLLDENAVVRLAATNALTKIGPDSSAIANLLQNLKNDKLPAAEDETVQMKIQVSVIDCLAAIGPPGKTAAIDALRDREELTLNSIGALSITPSLPNLKRLRTATTNEGLVHVGRATGLKSLNLDKSEITDAGFAHLKELDKLEEISFRGTPVTGSGLGHLGEVNMIKRLDCGGDVTDKGLETISRFPKLQYLRFSGHQVTDAGIQQLSNLRNLEELNVSHSGVNDNGTQHIGQIASLRRLNIYMSSVTDLGLEKLTALKNLEYLAAGDGYPRNYFPSLTPRGVEKLRRQLPNLKQVDVRDR